VSRTLLSGDELDGRAVLIFAVPVKVPGLGTFPVRAFAFLDRCH